jgi:hypothetical protein
MAKKAAKPKVRLLTGGNPQIPAGKGNAPINAYIAAMPGWKSKMGRTLDRLIVQTVPHVAKAVLWNQPHYGNEGDGWFLSIRCINRYVQVTFFRGGRLRPLPPLRSNELFVRRLNIYEEDAFDVEQFKTWVKQASREPGWVPVT